MTEKRKKEFHGMTNSPEYVCWYCMKDRCYREKNKSFKYYGGRGIKVCKRWKDSFLNFFSDMGKRPTKKHSIDRINCDGDYEPNNCRWATQDIQIINRKKYKGNTSKHRGVSFKKEQMKFVAQISINGKRKHLGYFAKESDASKAYEKKLKELYEKYESN